MGCGWKYGSTFSRSVNQLNYFCHLSTEVSWLYVSQVLPRELWKPSRTSLAFGPPASSMLCVLEVRCWIPQQVVCLSSYQKFKELTMGGLGCSGCIRTFPFTGVRKWNHLCRTKEYRKSRAFDGTFTGCVMIRTIHDTMVRIARGTRWKFI